MNETIIRRDESPLFSSRCKMARAAIEWCRDNHASVSAPANIVTALFSLGLVVKPPVLTDAERQAIEMAYSRLTCDANYEAVAATLRGLLNKTT
jgi:hypothetical protein